MRDPSLFRRETDPYVLYRKLHEIGPVLWDKWLRSWIVVGYEEIRRLSKDACLSGARVEAFYEQLPATAQTEMATLKNALSDMMLFNEPPRHTRLRQLIKPGITPAIIHEIRSVIEELTDELLDPLIPLGRMDVIHDYSEPLTREVMARLAGVPGHGKPLLQSWQGLLHEFYTLSRSEIPRVTALRNVFDEGAHARRAGTGTDAFSRVITDQLKRDEYTEDEIFANFLLLIDAGQATTTHQIGNAVLALIEHEDQQHLLRGHPELAANAAHEFLRFDSSVQFTSRVALAEIEIAGQRIKRGQSVALVLGAGNRDPRRYKDPDRLDLTRTAYDHLSFGHGIHYCLGASLALAETELAISRLLSRAADIRLEEPELAWVESINFRFLRRLPVSFTPIH
ncbi:MAG: cytochrome P450 [Candidatus Angelobacter sp.]